MPSPLSALLDTILPAGPFGLAGAAMLERQPGLRSKAMASLLARLPESFAEQGRPERERVLEQIEAREPDVVAEAVRDVYRAYYTHPIPHAALLGGGQHEERR